MPTSPNTEDKRRQLLDLLAQMRTANPFDSVTISRQIKGLSAEIMDEDQAEDTQTDEQPAVTAG